MPDMFATKRCSSFRNLSSKVDPAQLEQHQRVVRFQTRASLHPYMTMPNELQKLNDNQTNEAS